MLCTRPGNVPLRANTAALQAPLAQGAPSYVQAVTREQECQVVVAVLEALTGAAQLRDPHLQPAGRLAELCSMLKATLQRRACQGTEEKEGSRTRLTMTPCC